jgi:mono/diheme cytochrome c family protein
LYGKFCVHCHGDAGKGDGKVGAKLPGPPPAYDGALKNLSEGKMFYSISYGKGTMGPHGLIKCRRALEISSLCANITRD